MQHYLRPLLSPASVALVGASERPGSVGRVVYENLLAGGYGGDLYAVNPRHRTLLGRPCFASLAAIGAPVELAIIATPQRSVTAVLESAGASAPKVAVVVTAPSTIETDAARAWARRLAAAATRTGIRVVGPGALGVIRPAIGLNATYCAPAAISGRLALIAQSGGVATAVLDFATPLGIGFSTVISLGGAVDVAFGELLDLILLDPLTDGILLHVEDVGDARAFVSALRAAARTKPVVVLKAGRALDPSIDVTPDDVFDAALRRSGTVRVANYTQFFAAARMLARGRIPQGDCVAIVANGRGPAVLAADAAADRGLRFGPWAPKTAARLAALLSDNWPSADLVDVGSEADPERLADAVAIALDDPDVDAVVAMHVPRPCIPPLAAAEALARVSLRSAKPVLAAWMGAVDRLEVHAALEAGQVSNFFTPENAIDALSFLVAYRNNQQWLLEVPPPAPEPAGIDAAPLEALRLALIDESRTTLTSGETARILGVFGIVRADVFASLADAGARTTGWRYPLLIEPDVPGGLAVRRVVRSRRSLAVAWSDCAQAARASAAASGSRIVVRESARDVDAAALAIGVSTDRRFGPVIVVRRGSGRHSRVRETTLTLPPLNQRLAADIVRQAFGDDGETASEPSIVAATAELLTAVSALVTALPWVTGALLDPVVFDGARAIVLGATLVVHPDRKLLRGYPHMAIHPYPVELIGDVPLPDGATLHVRPIRPEDADTERAFVSALSERTRYYRFFYRLSELTPSMLARFTQVDYDRELALVALDAGAAAVTPAFVGVARYIANPDRVSAEFAVVIADAWQRRGVGRVLMKGLIVCAKRRGLERIEGAVLRDNEPMLAFVRALGFALRDDPADATLLVATLALG